MSFSQIPGAIGPVDSVKPPKYTDTCGHTPDEQPVCRGCDGEHGGPLYCVWCHGAELAREIQAACAAANREADAWKQIATAAIGERDTLLCQLQAQHVQATFDAPYLVAVGREAGR